MALPSTGPLSMSQVNLELGRSATATISLGESAVRSLAEVPADKISMQDLRGKANVFAFSITNNRTNANLRTLAVNAGWNETSAVKATINSDVVISGDTQGNSTAALTIDGSFPGGVTLVNDGLIVGRGGGGGAGGSGIEPTAGIAGSDGGLALLASTPCTVENNGTIAGGGGGGGGGGGMRYVISGEVTIIVSLGGGGGGGGRSSNTSSPGGAGGDGNSSARIGFPGQAGTLTFPGAGGSGRSASGRSSGNGGSGGEWGASGIAGQSSTGSGSTRAGGPGGGAGHAISGDSNITWVSFGTRLGGIL